jgi:hypothetical protein
LGAVGSSGPEGIAPTRGEIRAGHPQRAGAMSSTATDLRLRNVARGKPAGDFERRAGSLGNRVWLNLKFGARMAMSD